MTVVFNLPYVAVGVIISFTFLWHFATGKSTRGGIPSIAPRWQEWFTIFAFFKVFEYLKEGGRKYPNSCFRVPISPIGNVIVLDGKKLITELRDVPDEVFSFTHFTDKLIQSRYTMGRDMSHSHYHLPLIRSTLTRNIGALFPAMMEETRFSVNAAFENRSTTDWKTFTLHHALLKIVCQISNRSIVGPNLCRHEEFTRINIQHTIEVAQSTFLISLFPEALQPVFGPFLTRRKYYTRLMMKILKDEIEHRQTSLQKYGTEWPEKPNDYLMWLIEAAPSGREQTCAQLANRVLQFNFGAIHTTGVTLTHALLYLAAHPECAQCLREEMVPIIAEDGWTKVAMQKLRRMDSFLRETSRLNALGLTSVGRYSLKDCRLSNGTLIPKGSMVAVWAYGTHMDEDNYPAADQFKPFRFSDMREESGKISQHQMVAASPEYLAFGLGRHACPGRFFAANEIKAVLCYFVMNYDIKLPGGLTEKPPNRYYSLNVVLNEESQVLIRRREAGKMD